MQEELTPESSMSFIEKMAGGAFVCEVHDDHKLIFVNDNHIRTKKDHILRVVNHWSYRKDPVPMDHYRRSADEG